MAQSYKVEQVQALKDELKDFHSFIFTDYRGLKVQQINDLRNNLRNKGAHYHVIKNRYAKRVFQDLGLDGMDQYLVNPTAIAYFEENLSEIAKVLIDSAEETTLELKGGYSDGSVISSEELVKISKLPPRDVLLSQLLGVLQAPQRGLVTVLHGMLAKFVRTLKAVQEAKASGKVAGELASGIADGVTDEGKKAEAAEATDGAEAERKEEPKAEKSADVKQEAETTSKTDVKTEEMKTKKAAKPAVKQATRAQDEKPKADADKDAEQPKVESKTEEKAEVKKEPKIEEPKDETKKKEAD
jgi:large subunit ribosomal protein L10